MTTKTMLIVGAGLAVGGYLLLKPKNASAATVSGDFNGLPVGAVTGMTYGSRSGSDHYGAVVRAVVGARAMSQNGSAGTGSLVAGVLSSLNAKNAQAMGQISEKVIPGSGGIAQAVGQAVGQSSVGLVEKGGNYVVAGLKKLKFW